MNVAFIVTLDLDLSAGLNLESVALDLSEVLETVFPVVAVKPWARKEEPTQPISPRGQQLLALLANAKLGGVTPGTK